MKLLTYETLPAKVAVAFSGGVDSVAMALKAKDLKRDVTLAFFHHGNDYADVELEFCRDFAIKNDFKFKVGMLKEEYRTGSREKFWREQRHAWFNEKFDCDVLTGHHLNDAVEWYLLTCFRGQGQFMEYRNKNVVKPFLLHRKEDLVKFVVSHGQYWIEDPTNTNPEFTLRNRIRAEIMPHALVVNPGLVTTVKRRIMAKRAALGV